MKSLMILGGLVGFGLGLGVGLAQDGAWPDVFWRASVSALLAGLVLRWWGRVWLRCLHQSLQQRRAGRSQLDPVPAPHRAKL